MNFKIRVVENIGTDSEEVFGTSGTVLEVINGEFEDLDGFLWGNDGNLFKNISDVNNYFSKCDDDYHTKFELVDEQEGAL